LIKPILIAVTIFFSLHASAQDIQPTTATSKDSLILAPKLAGGDEAWFKFLNKNINQEVPENNDAPHGKYTVIVSFLVDTTGKISDPIIEQDPGYGTADDVKKALRKCPLWIPATRDGIKIPYRQKMNIVYQVM
jgi:periplasmic protein TonB